MHAYKHKSEHGIWNSHSLFNLTPILTAFSMATIQQFSLATTYISNISIMHLIDANKVDQQIQTHYMLWAIRNVKEMHPTIGSKLN